MTHTLYIYPQPFKLNEVSTISQQNQ